MENIPHGLKEAIEKDELVLFIGAGLSWDLKNTEGKTLGGWKEMVSSILSYLKDKEYITAEEQQSYDKLEPIGALKKLEDRGISRREIGDFLKHYFTLKKSKKLPIHKKAFRLSTKIITTNYDRAFEIAFPELQEIKAYKTKDYELNKLKKDPIFLFKLHGCIEHIDSMVLFPSDYDKLYKSTGREAEHALYALRNLIFNKTFLFIGTGMGDPQITSFFEEIKRTQGIYNQEHFIITFEPLKESLNFLTPIKINNKKEIPGVIDRLLGIKKDADAKKSSEKELLLEQLKASEKEKEAHEKELNKEKDKNKRQALLLKREANNHFRSGLKHHMAEEYLEATEEYKAAAELEPKSSNAYYNWGRALDDLAKTKPDSEAKELREQAVKKYKEATKIKQDFYEAYNNWGATLGWLAENESGSEAEKLFKESIAKSKKAIQHKKDCHQSYSNWGYALGMLAKTTSGSEAEELYKEAYKKYDAATRKSSDTHKTYCIWGITLSDQAKTKSGSEAEELYKEAFEKYNLAITYKQNYHKAYYYWGIALKELAKTKSGNEAETLYKEVLEKYNLAIKYGGKSYNLACHYAIRNQKAEALKYLEHTLARNEITVDFVEQDEDWKNLRNDPDFQNLLSRYKK